MIKKIILFLKDIKFEHSLFALPFAYLGLFLAEGRMPSAHLWIWVTAAMVSFRTLAMALNRLFDASIDARNPRTQGRAIPSGKLSKGSVIAVSFLSLLLFEISAFILGPLCFLLSPVPFVLAAVYPVMKRVSGFRILCWAACWRSLPTARGSRAGVSSLPRRPFFARRDLLGRGI